MFHTFATSQELLLRRDFEQRLQPRPQTPRPSEKGVGRALDRPPASVPGPRTNPCVTNTNLCIMLSEIKLLNNVCIVFITIHCGLQQRAQISEFSVSLAGTVRPGAMETLQYPCPVKTGAAKHRNSHGDLPCRTGRFKTILPCRTRFRQAITLPCHTGHRETRETIPLPCSTGHGKTVNLPVTPSVARKICFAPSHHCTGRRETVPRPCNLAPGTATQSCLPQTIILPCHTWRRPKQSLCPVTPSHRASRNYTIALSHKAPRNSHTGCHQTVIPPCHTGGHLKHSPCPVAVGIAKP